MKQPIIYSALSETGRIVRFAAQPFDNDVPNMTYDFPICALGLSPASSKYPMMSFLSKVSKPFFFRNEDEAVTYLVEDS